MGLIATVLDKQVQEENKYYAFRTFQKNLTRSAEPKCHSK